MSDHQNTYETDIKELESINSEGAESYLVNLFPENVYQSFGSILAFARELNVQIPVPEFVFIGRPGHGKSAVIEAFIGHAINALGENTGGEQPFKADLVTTKRPVFISLVNNPNVDAKEPRITVRRDLSNIGMGEVDRVFGRNEVQQITEEITKRSAKASNVPVYVTIESNDCLNITLIDTPGLDATSNEVEDTILSIVRPAHRHIICVEEANEWGKLQMFNFVKRSVDPSMTRTTLVYTKFNSLLKTSLNNTAKVNRYLQTQPRDTRVFFVTLPSYKVREQCLDTEKFREKIYQAYARDKQNLDLLQYDKRYSGNVGIHNLRAHLQQLAWKNYQNHIPQILKKLRNLKRNTQNKIEKLQVLLGSLDSSRLRTIATNYVVHFLQIVEKLIAGTSEGNPTVNGQTLYEEKSQGNGEWFDSSHTEISVSSSEWNIPYANSRLYGGTQFERLMSEFKAVVDHMAMPEVTLDDIATASGVNKLNNLPNHAYAACDIAQQKVRDAMGTLIDQLCKRAVYIMKRLTTVVEKVMESRKKSGGTNPNAGSMTGFDMLDNDEFDKFPYFVYHVKDLFNEFVDQTADLVRDKCLDEFYSTSTIYWDQHEIDQLQVDIPKGNDINAVRDSVSKLSTKIFDSLKQRMAKNIMLKFYNFFLIPMQSSLWNEIQGTVTCLSDQALAEIFEINAVKDKLSEDDKVLRKVYDRCVTQETEFLKSSTVFSHPVQYKSSDDEYQIEDDRSGSFGQLRSGPPPTLLGGGF